MTAPELAGKTGGRGVESSVAGAMGHLTDSAPRGSPLGAVKGCRAGDGESGRESAFESVDAERKPIPADRGLWVPLRL